MESRSKTKAILQDSQKKRHYGAQKQLPSPFCLTKIVGETMNIFIYSIEHKRAHNFFLSCPQLSSVDYILCENYLYLMGVVFLVLLSPILLGFICQ